MGKISRKNKGRGKQSGARVSESPGPNAFGANSDAIDHLNASADAAGIDVDDFFGLTSSPPPASPPPPWATPEDPGKFVVGADGAGTGTVSLPRAVREGQPAFWGMPNGATTGSVTLGVNDQPGFTGTRASGTFSHQSNPTSTPAAPSGNNTSVTAGFGQSSVGQNQGSISGKHDRYAENGTGTHFTAGATYGKEVGTASGGVAISTPQGDGRTQAGVRGAVGSDGKVSVGADLSDTTKVAGGGTREDKTGFGFAGLLGESDRSMNLSRSSVTRKADGSVDRGSSGDVTIGSNEVSGRASVTKGPVTASLSGGVTLKFDEPKLQPDGRWAVEYVKTTSAGGSVGVEGTAGPLGVGASVGGNVAGSQTGKKFFASEAEAERFRHQGAHALPDVTSAEGVADMQVGEKAGVGSQADVGVDASLSLGMVGVGAGVKTGIVDAKDVVVVDEKWVDVTVSASRFRELTGTASVAAVGLSGSQKDETSEMQTLRFDRSTEEGRAAYASLMGGGKLGTTGYKVMSTTHGKAQTNSTKISAPLLNFEQSHRVAEDFTVMNTENGPATREDYVGEDSSGLRIPLVGHHKVETTGTATQVNNVGQGYVTNQAIDSNDAGSTSRALAKATGTTAEDVDGDTPRKWNVQNTYSPDQLASFVEQVRSGGASAAWLNTLGAEPLNALRRQLAAAGDDEDEQARAMSAFLAETGSKGDRVLRDNVGAPARTDVQVEGDRNFLGAAGWQAHRAQGEDLIAEAANPDVDPTRVIETSIAAINDLKPRLAALRDPSLYPELPEALREKEIARFQFVISQYDRAISRARKHPRVVCAPPPATQPSTPAHVERKSATTEPEELKQTRFATPAAAVAPTVSPMTAAVDRLREAVDGLDKVIRTEWRLLSVLRSEVRENSDGLSAITAMPGLALKHSAEAAERRVEGLEVEERGIQLAVAQAGTSPAQLIAALTRLVEIKKRVLAANREARLLYEDARSEISRSGN
jgi:hypothetical protein